MTEKNKLEGLEAYSTAEGLELALTYLDDPSNVTCPRCGPGTMEVLGYLRPDSMQGGVMVAAVPEGDYTVVLYCHGCACAAALDFNPASATRRDTD